MKLEKREIIGHDKQTDDAIRFAKQFNTAFFEGILYYQDNENLQWFSENDDEILRFIQGSLPEETTSYCSNVYKKLRANTPIVQNKIYTKPTLFLNNQIFEYDTQSKKFVENIDNTSNTFNIYNIDLKVNFEIESFKKEKEKLNRLLNLLFPNPEIRDWALANYFLCFIPYNLERLIFNYGQGQDGKSTIMNLIQNICKNSASTFNLNEKGQFAFSNFNAKSCMIDTDFDSNVPIDIQTLKKKTTNGWIEIERKNKNKTSIYNNSTLITASNFMPKFNDISNATERRLAIIKFENSMKTRKDLDWFSNSETREILQNETFQYLFLQSCKESFERLYDDNSGEITMPKIIQEITERVCEENNQIYVFLKTYKNQIVDKLNEGEVLDLHKVYDENYVEFKMLNNLGNTGYSNKNFYRAVETVLQNKFGITVNREDKILNGKTQIWIKKVEVK